MVQLHAPPPLRTRMACSTSKPKGHAVQATHARRVVVRRRCFVAWRVWAACQRSAEDKVIAFRAAWSRKLASVVLHEWARLSWLLPREERAAALAAHWLQRRGLLGWRRWLHDRRRWQQLGESLATRWTNLHLATAFQAWRSWVQTRQEKERLASSVAKRWNNLHLAAAFQAWMELVQVHVTQSNHNSMQMIIGYSTAARRKDCLGLQHVH